MRQCVGDVDTTFFTITSHDSVPEAEGRLVDQGIGSANDAAAPLHEVEPLSCFVRDGEGRVIGGAVGRRWNECCELQQLWVAAEHRSKGLGASLVCAFEARARGHGCRRFYLETFSFQAPGFYQKLGYQIVCDLAVYPHGIHRFVMVKDQNPDPPASRR